MRGKIAILFAVFLLVATFPLGFTTGHTRQNGHQNGHHTDGNGAKPVAIGNDIYCAGFISETVVSSRLRIISSERGDINFISQRDVVHINGGSEQGIKEGGLFKIVRPIGLFKNPYTKARLGYLTQELGVLRVIAVRENSSTAIVTFACTEIGVGEMLLPFEQRISPQVRPYQALDRYGAAKERLTGRIILERGGSLSFGERSVVHIDLGADHGVKAGDYFTIYRMAHEVGPEKKSKDKVINNLAGEKIRKVLGELVVIHVEKKASTAIITRTIGEVDLGDFVEIQ